MKITILLTLVILAAAVFIGAHSPSFTVNSGSRPLPTPTSTPSFDLTTINVGGNKMCYPLAHRFPMRCRNFINPIDEEDRPPIKEFAVYPP